jgi:hypothetical protein
MRGRKKVHLDVDRDRDLLSMTVEHTKSSDALSELVYREYGALIRVAKRSQARGAGAASAGAPRLYIDTS